MSKGKIVSLKRAWLATLTPEERAERKRDLRHWRDMTKTNEAFLAEHKAAMSAAVLQKIEDRIAEEVTASLRDPASTTLAEIVAITRASCENLLKNDEVRALAIEEAIDSLYLERLFTYHRVMVGPRPR